MNNKRKRSVKSTLLFRFLAGAYLLYLDYSIWTDWEQVKSSEKIVVILFMIFFASVGILLIAYTARELNRLKHEPEIEEEEEKELNEKEIDDKEIDDIGLEEKEIEDKGLDDKEISKIGLEDKELKDEELKDKELKDEELKDKELKDEEIKK